MPRWSPDGKRIAYGAPGGGRWETFIIDADGGAPVRIEAPEGAFGVGGWSTDGRWLYFGAREGLFKLPVKGGAAVQLSKERGFRPLESADGRYLYYSTGGRMRQPGGGAPIRRIPLAGGEPEDVLPATADPSQWALAPNGIYYAGEAERGRYSVRFYDFASRATRLVAELPKPVGPGISISPDARTLLYTQIDQEDSDILLIENFR
jgi:Tol biopolymer transport system component